MKNINIKIGVYNPKKDIKTISISGFIIDISKCKTDNDILCAVFNKGKSEGIEFGIRKQGGGPEDSYINPPEKILCVKKKKTNKNYLPVEARK